MAENVDITLLAKVCQDTLSEAKAIRRDLADVQSLAVKTVDVLGLMERRSEARFNVIETRFAAIDERLTAIEGRFGVADTRFAAIDSRFAGVDARLRGIDQRMTDLKDGLELMIKRELMTALGSFELRMIGLIEERLARRD
jgi:hypothetical protein